MKKILAIIATILILSNCAIYEQKQHQEAMKLAHQEAGNAIQSCRKKRLSGELKTHVESVQCSNPLVIQAYAKALYPYMDLVQLRTIKRLDIAERTDKKEITETQGLLEIREYTVKLDDMARQRDYQARTEQAANNAAFAAALQGAASNLQATQQRNMDSITEQMNANRTLNCNPNGIGGMTCH